MNLAAIGFTAVGVCARRGWRSRASSLGLGAAILMLAAMVDSAYVHRLSVVVWIALLLAAAIALGPLAQPGECAR